MKHNKIARLIDVLSKAHSKIRPLLFLMAMNQAVFFGVLSKLWFVAAGAITVFMIAVYFSPELQGYYFTFYSLLSLQVFVELGLTAVIISFASHEWANLGLDEHGRIVGGSGALSRLRSLARVVFKWYVIGAMFLFVVLSCAGYLFFSRADQVGIHWVAPWISICLVACLNLSLLPAFSILEGCNQVKQVYFYRFIQEVIRSLATWLIIVLGGGLWSLTGATLAVALWGISFLLLYYRNFFKTLLIPIPEPGLNWWKEVWPMQWRIAVSWLSGYFCFSLFTPAMFHFRGPIEAGQLGMTWSMVMALSFISSMWITTRAPEFGILISQKKYKELDRLLFYSGRVSVGIACLGSVIIFLFVFWLYHCCLPIAYRFLPPLPTFFFLCATILMQISTSQSTYLRAHKKEPLMLLSLLSGIITALSVIIVGSRWGSLGIAVSYFAMVAFFGLPFGSIIWFRSRNTWHSDNFADPEIVQSGVM